MLTLPKVRVGGLWAKTWSSSGNINSMKVCACPVFWVSIHSFHCITKSTTNWKRTGANGLDNALKPLPTSPPSPPSLCPAVSIPGFPCGSDEGLDWNHVFRESPPTCGLKWAGGVFWTKWNNKYKNTLQNHTKGRSWKGRGLPVLWMLV